MLDTKTSKCYNTGMYKVIDNTGFVRGAFDSLDTAMEAAKLVDEFVTIKSADFEICGIFGVDSVENGVCPDGVKYDWNKANRIGRTTRSRL
jgi:hypothetical protein